MHSVESTSSNRALPPVAGRSSGTMPDRTERIEALRGAIRELERQIAEAGALPLIRAREHWRKRGEHRYLVLIHPMVDGRRPNPTYIGSKPEKIKAALDGIRRTAAYDHACRKLAGLRSELEADEQAGGPLVA